MLSSLLQSSPSSSAQYIGLCPMVIIHGLLALCSGALAACEEMKKNAKNY
jgi:hypothetical protein